MATNTNTIKTRIQLKSDTEANWNKAGPKDGSLGFVPLRGEIIIYSADDTHAFSRLKVGDGATNVVALPFIDAGTLNGEEVELVKCATSNEFPQSGSSDKLYVDLSTNYIYHYERTGGYTKLSNFTFSVSKSTMGSVTRWSAGLAATAKVENNILKITNGLIPELLWEQRQVVTDVTEGE